MHNRTATAIFMALGETLAHMEIEHGVSRNTSNHILGRMLDNADKLLKGEKVAEKYYPEMELTGNNIVFVGMNEVVNVLTKDHEIWPEEVE